MYVRRKRARLASRMAALAVLVLALGLPTTATIAGADTNQSNGCWINATNSFSGTPFVVPITGDAVPDPDVLPGQITLTGVSLTVAVDATFIGAGIALNLVSSATSTTATPDAPNLENIGFLKNDGAGDSIPDANAGINTVSILAGRAVLRLQATNTVEGTGLNYQTATNTAAVTTVFYVTANVDGANPIVYTSVTNAAPGQPGPDPTRTGTPLVGNLTLPIPLDGHKVPATAPPGATGTTAGATVWTPVAAGTVAFTEENSHPPVPTNPSAAPGTPLTNQTDAAIQINTSVSGLPINFRCWVGSVDNTVTPVNWLPGAASIIDSVTVTGEATTTTAPATTTTAPATTTTAPATTTTAPATTTTAPATTTTAPATTTTAPATTTTAPATTTTAPATTTTAPATTTTAPATTTTAPATTTTAPATTTTAPATTTTAPATTTTAPATTTTVPAATTTSTTVPTECKAGWGFGDKNHCHSGPPGRTDGENQPLAAQLISNGKGGSGASRTALFVLAFMLFGTSLVIRVPQRRRL